MPSIGTCSSDAGGHTYALEAGDYFRDLDGAMDEWLFKAAPYGNQSEPLSYDLTEIRSLPAGWMEKRMKIEIVHCPT